MIKCGDTIRLQHLSTNKNLHSHHFSSPLSGNQEISCYGEEGIDSFCHWNTFITLQFIFIFRTSLILTIRFTFFFRIGIGDTGDHWKVVCSDDVWLRSDPVKFYHIDTDVYLSVSGRTFGRLVLVVALEWNKLIEELIYCFLFVINLDQSMVKWRSSVCQIVTNQRNGKQLKEFLCIPVPSRPKNMSILNSKFASKEKETNYKSIEFLELS